jgi:hypothetical protein
MLSFNCFGWSSVCFGIEAKQTKQTFKTNQNTLKKTLRFQKKYQNMISIKLFWLLLCFFRFSRNTESLCLGIEAKQAKQAKQTFLFRIVPKLDSVPVSVVRRTPYP